MNKVLIVDGDTLEGLALSYYGKLDVFKLLKDNTSLNINSQLFVGDTINIDDAFSNEPYIIQNKIVRKSDRDVITSDTVVGDGQNIEDLAIQLYGSLNSVFDLCRDNNINSLSTTLIAGRKIIVDINKVLNKDVLLVYKRNGTIVNTGANNASSVVGGIGFMGIELNFKVS
jgi:hypothetical protein